MSHSYEAELRAKYLAVRQRLNGVTVASVQTRPTPQIAPIMHISGSATGGMWNGLNPNPGTMQGLLKGYEITTMVKRILGVSHADFISARRGRHLAEPRWIACWFMSHYTALSMANIGKLVGDRDHSTVVHGIKRVNDNPERFAKRIEAVAAALRIALPREVPFQ